MQYAWRWTLMLLAWVACPELAAQVSESDKDFPITPDSILLRRDTTLMQRSPSDTLRLAVPRSMGVLPDKQLNNLIESVRPPFNPNPIRSLWLSLVLPGAGQIYNRKYWKLPIVYGGFIGCAYALTWNNQMLSDYSQAYLDIMDNDPTSKSYEKMLPIGYNISGREEQFKNIFKNKKNYYRKYRDMSILAFIAVYAIIAIDAYVDAELSAFDISEDLSMRLSPAIITSSPYHSPDNMAGIQNMAVGMSVSLTY